MDIAYAVRVRRKYEDPIYLIRTQGFTNFECGCLQARMKKLSSLDSSPLSLTTLYTAMETSK